MPCAICKKVDGNGMVNCYYCGREICVSEPDHTIDVFDNRRMEYFCKDCYEKVDLHNKIWGAVQDNRPSKKFVSISEKCCLYCKKELDYSKQNSYVRLFEDGHWGDFCNECYEKADLHGKIWTVIRRNKPTSKEQM